MYDVAVPRGGRPPSRRDDKAVIGWIMFGNFEDRLTLFPRYSPDMTKKQQALPEYRAEPRAIQVDRNAKQQPGQPCWRVDILDDLHDSVLSATDYGRFACDGNDRPGQPRPILAIGGRQFHYRLYCNYCLEL
ncbi:hypothetical protein MHAE_09360 [Mycobacterium haemophilum DSM 44634]